MGQSTKEMKVVVVTGATSGVGEALARRLLEESKESITLCLACRNLSKAQVVKENLLHVRPNAHIDLVHLDTSRPSSARAAARELTSRYDHVDVMYFNAGVMLVSHLDWGVFWPPAPSKLSRLFRTGAGIMMQYDEATPDGLQMVFTTNVAGHYIMLREMEPFLAAQGPSCHVIWTSSNSAAAGDLDPADIQNRQCVNPYQTSKRAMDLLSIELNRTMNTKGVYSDVVCPGTVMTQMTYNLLPKWAWFMLMPLWILVRMFANFYTLTAFNGAEAQVWLSWQDPSVLDHTVKYRSMCSTLGRRYVATSPIEPSEALTGKLMEELNSIAERYGT